MGVHGLWKLLEAAGKPIPLESLDNKVLAVDVSIWLHQLVKGFQDSRGSPVPNAHLLGLFHRVCKLLFYRIKPVFVFDGGVPLLKRQTIAARKKLKTQATQDAAQIREQLLKNLIKRKAVRRVLQGKETSDGSKEVCRQGVADMFYLPPQNVQDSEDSESDLGETCNIKHQPIIHSSDSDSESEHEVKMSPLKFHRLNLDLHSLDVTSEHFLSLPPDVRHDILSELQETRKQNSWGRLHEMPGESNDFSSFQLGRLIKRRNVQVSLKQAEKEMGGKVLSLNELQDLMSAQGVNINDETSKLIDSSSRKIASDAATRYLLLKESSVIEAHLSSQEATSTELAKHNYKDKTLGSCEVTNSLSLFDDNWSSDEEKAQDHINDVLAKALDSGHDDLSQEQILALIQSNTENKKAKMYNTSIDGPSTSTANVIEKSAEDHFEKVLRVEENSFTPIDNELQDVEEDSFKLDSLKEISPQPKESHIKSSLSTKYEVDSFEVHFKKKQTQERLTPTVKNQSRREDVNNEDVESLTANCDQTKLSSADSDSDDFQEVVDKSHEVLVPVARNHELPVSEDGPSIGSHHKDCDVQIGMVADKLNNQKAIEIVINPEQNPEDDIFSDIFSSPDLISGEKKENNVGTLTVLNNERKNDSLSPFDPQLFSVLDFKREDGGVDSSDTIKSSSEHIESNNTLKLKETSDFNVASKFLEDKDENVGEFSQSSNESSNQELSENNDESIRPLFTQPLSTSELQKLENSLQEEEHDLNLEKGRQERLAASITEQMCVEAQELLQLFGLPYIVAPMEAEAQCAFLDAISLTEGTITDDSDIWLFGGRKVYKNFFNQKKHVLQYTSANIHHYFKLTREQLVQLALLVGSDYTVGLQGIGPVTALEVISAFSTNIEASSIESSVSGLKHFKTWCLAGCPNQSPQKQRLGKKLKNVKVSDGFPNQAVVEAYLRPAVDDSRETFSWGALDLPSLRDYARSKFGWTTSKTDEILLPVSKRWSDRKNQRSIDSYFNIQPMLKQGLSKMSKRVQRAVHSMSGRDNPENTEDIDDPEPLQIGGQKSGKRKLPHKSGTQDSKQVKRKRTVNTDSISFIDNEDCEKEDKVKELPVRAPTKPRNRTRQGIKRVGVESVGKEKVKTSSIKIDQTTSIQSTNLDAAPTAKRKRIKSTKDKERVTDSFTAETKIDVQSSLKPTLSTPCDTNAPGDDQYCEPSTSGRSSTKSCYASDKSIRKSRNMSSDTDDKNSASQSMLFINQESDSDIEEEGKPQSNRLSPSIPLNHREGEDLEKYAALELEAASAFDWKDDPWDDGPSYPAQRRPRQKLYFGGIRPNKPTKRQQPRQRDVPPPPPPGSDSRGMRPGWRTEQQIQSRDSVWLETAQQTKKGEVIPQRERDRQAQEHAKMKAIQLMKASDTLQASRILGGAKRGRARGKAKPIHKELAEHNLSESSSDE